MLPRCFDSSAASMNVYSLQGLGSGPRAGCGCGKTSRSYDQRPVMLSRTDRLDALFSEHGAAVARRLGSQSAERANPAARPGADDHVRGRRRHANHRLTARAHHGVQRLDAVNAVPEQVWVMFLQFAGTVCLGPQYLAGLSPSSRCACFVYRSDDAVNTGVLKCWAAS